MNRLFLLYKYFFIILFFFTIRPVCYGNTRAHCENLYELAVKEYGNKNYAKSLEYLLQVKELSTSNGWSDILARSLNNMGLVYMHILDYEKAMECYLDGYEIVLNGGYELTELSILSNLAQLCFVNKELDKAIEYLDKAYIIAYKLNDTVRIGRLAINVAIVANETGEYDKASLYLDDAISILGSNDGYPLSLLKARLEKVKNLYLRENYEKAEKLSLEILEGLYDSKYNEEKSLLELFLSQIYEKKKESKKAIYYGHQALGSNPSLTLRIRIYDQLANLYKENNLYQQAFQYQDSLLLAKDSLSHLNDNSRVENMQVRLALIDSEKKLEENKSKQKSERAIFIFVLIIALILIWVLRIQLKTNRQKRSFELEKEKNEKLLLEKQLKEQETLALLEQERLNNEIDAMNRQLTAKVLLQSNRNELIGEIIDKLSGVSDPGESIELESIIRQLKQQMKESTDWDSFLAYFEQINPAFLSLLKEKHSDLTANDIRLLSYIYINLDTKEISKLLNITTDHCRKKKQRLAKKMNLPVSGIYDYLVSIF